ncbi:MAG: DUF169 domain-containing protein [Proteobacteria bacterium]|nr:DUF169 domain-containing protein [Pseudomonadota bacterium]
MEAMQQYAERLMRLEQYERPIIGFRLCDKTPFWAAPYGDDQSFGCAITAEACERDKPLCITGENIMCGGGVYAGIGMPRMKKEAFDAAMSMVIGEGSAFATRQVMRRATQQIPHHFKRHKYLAIGRLEQMPEADMVMIIADVAKVMRLCKAYTWETGELVHGIQGTTWCGQSLAYAYRKKVPTFNFGCASSRPFMKLGPGELFFTIHRDLLPIIVKNIEHVSVSAME